MQFNNGEFKVKMLNGEMSLKKYTEKIMLLKVKDLMHIANFRT